MERGVKEARGPPAPSVPPRDPLMGEHVPTADFTGNNQGNRHPLSEDAVQNDTVPTRSAKTRLQSGREARAPTRKAVCPATPPGSPGNSAILVSARQQKLSVQPCPASWRGRHSADLTRKGGSLAHRQGTPITAQHNKRAEEFNEDTDHMPDPRNQRGKCQAWESHGPRLNDPVSCPRSTSCYCSPPCGDWAGARRARKGAKDPLAGLAVLAEKLCNAKD